MALADTYYVGPAGNDGNSGTSEDRAFRVVQHAVERMQAGDTLVVLDGVYTGSLKLRSGITIRAKNPRKVIFSGLEPLKVPFERPLIGSCDSEEPPGNAIIEMLATRMPKIANPRKTSKMISLSSGPTGFRIDYRPSGHIFNRWCNEKTSIKMAVFRERVPARLMK
jgi:hypothetical protein